MTARSEQVDFHFDVMCPWAYQSAVWIREVRRQTGLEISWRFFSLEEVNRQEGKKHPWERPWSYGWSLLRIAAHLRRRSMDDVDRFYEVAGRRLHVEGRKPHTPDGARDVLAEIGIDPALVDEAIDDPTTHDEVLTDHRRVVDVGGFGVPTLFFGDTCLFGPVVVPAPTGAAAVRLWELVQGWREFPSLYELRRPKTREDWMAINDAFEPYLTARDWITIQKPVA
jgi:2-hydroxychromene-2-carboxylate isomerase